MSTSSTASLNSQIEEKEADLKIVNDSLSAIEGIISNADSVTDDFSNLLRHISDTYKVTFESKEIYKVKGMVDYIGYTKDNLVSAKDELESDIKDLQNKLDELFAQEAKRIQEMIEKLKNNTQ